MNASGSRLIATDRTSERALFLLKTRGPMPTATLAERLSITVPGVRQHLTRLSEMGLVTSGTMPSGVGRPARVWALTALGHGRFPDTHAETLVGLLQSIRATLGEAALERVIEARSDDVETSYRAKLGELPRGASLAERLQALAELRRTDGYMAEVTEVAEGEWVLAENHCPICAAAAACQGFCRSELELFRTLLGEDAAVSRSEHLLAGARRCAYRITQRAGDAAAADGQTTHTLP